jgi:hypothetical protein
MGGIVLRLAYSKVMKGKIRKQWWNVTNSAVAGVASFGPQEYFESIDCLLVKARNPL